MPQIEELLRTFVCGRHTVVCPKCSLMTCSDPKDLMVNTTLHKSAAKTSLDDSNTISMKHRMELFYFKRISLALFFYQGINSLRLADSQMFQVVHAMDNQCISQRVV